MGFDKKLFAELLENAKGDRSINKYANEINISPAHISRLLRQLIDTPPSPETIYKFASGAYNEVSYDDLMHAAGHIDEKKESSDYGKLGKLENLERNVLKIIVSELYDSDFEWSIFKSTDKFPDLCIEIKNGKYSKWLIDIKSFTSLTTIYFIYGQIASYELGADVKVTIAVSTEREFTAFLARPPKSLRANLFVMFVDLEEGKIVKEEMLCRY